MDRTGETVPVTHLLWKGWCLCSLEIPFGVFLGETFAFSTLILRILQVAGSGQLGSFPSPFTNRE